MSNVALSLRDRIELVRAAIDRIHALEDQWRKEERDATSTSGTRRRSKKIFEVAEREFSWQWQNVEVILEEGLK